MNVESQKTPSQGLKGRLIEVATELLAQPREMKLPTMRDIATAAAVAPGAAYRHFESQDELFLAVITNLFGQLEQAIQTAVETAQSSHDAILKTCQAYASWGINNAGGFQLLFETTDDLNMKATEQKPGVHLIDELAALLAAPSEPKATEYVVATRLWTSLHGVVSLRLHKLGMVWPTTLESDIEILVQTALAK